MKQDSIEKHMAIVITAINTAVSKGIKSIISDGYRFNNINRGEVIDRLKLLGYGAEPCYLNNAILIECNMNTPSNSPCYKVKKAIFDMDKNPYKKFYDGKPGRGRPTNEERERRKKYNEWEVANRKPLKYGVIEALLNRT